MHYIDEKWVLHSHAQWKLAVTVMETEERHAAETCTEHLTDVAQ